MTHRLTTRLATLAATPRSKLTMAYEIATNDIIMIPLNKLIPSSLNARKITTSAESNAELRASLLAFGVLENLIVYGAGKDKYAVAA